jgi:two-component system, LytTR family, response regulator
MISAYIVDDEPYCCETLVALLEAYCPDIKVAGVYFNGRDALEAIKKYSPDLVFLDVEMPHMNGFEMLQGLSSINFELIFSTSYDQYALKAIRYSALDYLLKPVDADELQAAVQKVIARKQKPISEQIEILLQKIHAPSTPVTKIAMPTMEGLQMIHVNSIVTCEADSNYTIIHLKEKKMKTVSCTLKEMEELLEDHSFVRVHRCYLVNLNEVDKYIKGEGGYLLMTDGSSVDVSRSKKEILMKRLLPK